MSTVIAIKKSANPTKPWIGFIKPLIVEEDGDDLPHVVKSGDFPNNDEIFVIGSYDEVNRYRFQEFLAEISEASLGLAESWGLRRRAGETELYRRPESLPPPERRSWLAGLIRGEAGEQGETILSFAFRHAPPRLGLRPADQSLLDLALEGITDAEMATLEMLAAPALPAASEGEDLAVSSRRRLLLNYLRAHPEELAPGAA